MTDLYFGSVLSSFENGVQLDLRVKLAVDFLKAHPSQGKPEEGAKYALDLADALLTESTARGLIKELPDDGSINSPLRHHIERSVRAQVYQNTVVQKIAADEAPLIGGLNGQRLPGLSS